LLAAASRVDQAKDHLRTATELYAEMNAGWATRQAAARLRPLGIRLGTRGPRRRAWVGWEALTPVEQRVATEVGTGRSNPEIAAALRLSRNTVETHVSHILVKLGVRSRRDIAQESILHASG
jgi:DNA-binding CsgD family transcriptional regulator